MSTTREPLTLAQLRVLAHEAGLTLTEEQLQQLLGEHNDLMPRLRRLEEIDLADVEPDRGHLRIPPRRLCPGGTSRCPNSQVNSAPLRSDGGSS